MPSASPSREQRRARERGYGHRRAEQLSRHPVLSVYAIAVVANYAAQVPYVLDLYGTRFSGAGVALLLATLAWFLIGLVLYTRGMPFGSLVLMGYVVAQVAFYTLTDVLGEVAGAGLTFQLAHARDSVVWIAFVAGAINFIAALALLAVFVRSARRSPPEHR
jgi:hypothetical protein